MTLQSTSDGKLILFGVNETSALQVAIYSHVNGQAYDVTFQEYKNVKNVQDSAIFTSPKELVCITGELCT